MESVDGRHPVGTLACTEVYLGCIDDAFWPGVPWRSYGHCAEDWVRGWVYDGARRPITWCLCDSHDDCNVNIGDAGSKPMSTLPTMTPATDSATSQRTQVHRSALPLRLSKALFTRYNRLSNPFDNRFDKTAVSRIQPVVKPVIQPGLMIIFIHQWRTQDFIWGINLTKCLPVIA